MAKEIKYNVEAREMLKEGVDALSNAVKVTLGRENRENQRLIIRFCDGMFYDDDSNSKDKGFLSGV